MLNNQIQIFNNEKFGDIRTITIDGEPWFIAKDVCDILCLGRGTRSVERLDEDEVRKTYITDSIGRQQEAYIVNEPGLYQLVIASNKKEAKEFKRWITHDIIPSIRKHGMYMTDSLLQKVMQDPDFLITLLQQYKDEREMRLLAEKKNEEQKPLVDFANACLKSKDTILVREMSKIAQDEGISIGQNKLYDKMREWGLILKGSTEPSQRAMNMKLFEVQESYVETAYGTKLTKTTRVTPRGQVYIIEKLKQER